MTDVFVIQVSTNGYIVLFSKKPKHVTLPDSPPSDNPDIGRPLLAPLWTSVTADNDLTSIGSLRVQKYRRKYVQVVDKYVGRKFGITFKSKTTVSFYWRKVKCRSSKRGDKV